MSPLVLTSELRARVEQMRLSEGMLQAALLIRQETGAGPNEALTAVKGIYEASRPDPEAEMMAARVTCIGPFNNTLIPYLGYSPRYYKSTREGVTIIHRIFEAIQGSTQSRGLAAAFGADPWDFNTHHLDPAKKPT